MSEQKKIRLGEQAFTIEGIGKDDPYFGGIGDGYGGELFDFAKLNLDKKAVVLDVGANIGITAAILSQIAGTVHAFEPQPEVYSLLTKNVQENILANVKTWNFAVGSAPGSAHFSGSSAYGFISDDRNAPEVEIITIDDFVKAHDLERVDLIKIDVEGFEPHVIKGALKTIERFNPIVYMEFNSWALLSAGRANPRDFLDMLFEYFAEIHVVDAGGFRPGVSALHVLHDNIVNGGSVDDLIMLKKPRTLVKPEPKKTVSITDMYETISKVRNSPLSGIRKFFAGA